MDQEKTFKLIAEISELENSSKKHASRNHDYAYANAIAAVLASVFAAIVVSVEAVPRDFAAAVAIATAAVSAVAYTLRFEPKSQWFYERTHRLSELRRRLEFENADPAEISQELSRLEQEYQNNWVKFGSNSGKAITDTSNEQKQPTQ